MDASRVGACFRAPTPSPLISKTMPGPWPKSTWTCVCQQPFDKVLRVVEMRPGALGHSEPADPGLLTSLVVPLKAGGMRIVQKHPHSGDAKDEKDKDEQEWESPSPPKPTVFISGVMARGDKDFPPAAAQVAHQKPHASMDKHPAPRTQHIQQPRK
ncbi:PREDICTED: death-associated protein 1 [Condylura cristata]|uniref:death-associated protein 1 n=1 Tax=Condylura cristata TaxID=143302 RepID=UPI00033431E2|nr:PREDICTED: death-associated protein 1 [Condylura cristata]